MNTEFKLHGVTLLLRMASSDFRYNEREMLCWHRARTRILAQVYTTTREEGTNTFGQYVIE